jgi:hypothetical protein
MSPFFLTADKYQNMVNELTTGNEIKVSQSLVAVITKTCETLRDSQFGPFKTYWEGELKQMEDNPLYKQATTWKVPDNTIKTCKYVTPATSDINQKTKRIKDLYSKINLNENKNKFNGKVTFN